ncbi:MAG: cob(I)yrinic acid a,c-diamide adenosyltransferase [Chloroflexota bacterium]
MSPSYTGKGDKGKTGIIGREGLSKADIRIEAIGAVDEASAALGFARALTNQSHLEMILIQLQKDLYRLMAQLAKSDEGFDHTQSIGQKQIDWLEEKIAHFERELLMPDSFVLSGDSPAGGACALARTVIRRAERRVVALAEKGDRLNPFILKYLNRLSSLCFLLELAENQSSDKGGIALTND